MVFEEGGEEGYGGGYAETAEFNQCLIATASCPVDRCSGPRTWAFETLAPNAAQLGEAGYRLRRVQPVDMFPQTPHIEAVARFTR